MAEIPSIKLLLGNLGSELAEMRTESREMHAEIVGDRDHPGLRETRRDHETRIKTLEKAEEGRAATPAQYWRKAGETGVAAVIAAGVAWLVSGGKVPHP
jgi:hypothetical protein